MNFVHCLGLLVEGSQLGGLGFKTLQSYRANTCLPSMYIYIYMNNSLDIYTTCIWIHKCMHAYMHPSMYVCMHASMYVCIHTCISMCIYICIYVYLSIFIRMYYLNMYILAYRFEFQLCFKNQIVRAVMRPTKIEHLKCSCKTELCAERPSSEEISPRACSKCKFA